MNVVAEMLLTEPAPIAIWAVLMLLTLPAVLLLGNPDGLRHPRRAARETFAALRERGEHRLRRAQEAVQALRFAEEVRVAAGRAVACADRWREHWQHTEEGVTDAWQAWLEADSRLRTAVVAAAFGTPWTAPTCREYAARERFLHRSVSSAVERGDLPVAAIADALTGRGGWNAQLHPLEQELVVARASAAYRRYRYEQAVTVELAARHDAELSRRAAEHLQREAVEATARAEVLTSSMPADAVAQLRADHRAVAVLVS